jgi:hypothetical protein
MSSEAKSIIKKTLGTDKRLNWKLFLLSIALLAAISWTADFFNDLLKSFWIPDDGSSLDVLQEYSIQLILMIAIYWLSFRWAKEAWEESFHIKTVNIYPKAAICFLSDKKPNSMYNPWQMNETLLDEHPSIQTLIVITSAGETGSSVQFNDFKNEIEKARPHITIQHLADYNEGHGEDFNNLDTLKIACKKAYDRLEAEGFSDNEIIFDATSGTKECSIAATLSTLKEGRYLNYTDKTYKSKIYDING